MNVVFTLVLITLATAWMFTLRPQNLCGPAGYVMVQGVSMLPTYQGGDLVIVRREASYGRGDIVAYRVSAGDIGAGIVLIHRIVGGSGAEGFVMQGDGNPEPDDWTPRQQDIVGRAWIVVPRIGAMLAFLHAPLPLASIAAGIAVALLLAPSKKDAEGTAPEEA